MPTMQRVGFLGRHGSIGAGAPPTPAAPLNVIAPVISGTPASGQTLTVSSVGSWAGYPVPTFSYQWQDDGVNIGGATASSFLLTDTQIGGVVTCVVTATNSEGTDSEPSNGLGPVTAALAAPVNTVAPVASGTGTVGETLSVTDGTWTGNPTPTYAYQWRRNGSNIGGATSSTYLLVLADNGADVDCLVTATNSQGSASADSNDIAVDAVDVTPPTITNANSGTVEENATLSFALTADESVTWSIVGGADQAQFEISGSTLRWSSNGVRDFEIPADADANNAYVVQVRATDGASNTTNQTITITVTDVAEGGGTAGEPIGLLLALTKAA
jgi:hypothetical protein